MMGRPASGAVTGFAQIENHLLACEFAVSISGLDETNIAASGFGYRRCDIEVAEGSYELPF